MALFVNPRFEPEQICEEDLIVFFHAQRTGGSALRHVFARAYGADAVFSTQYAENFQHWDKVSTDDLKSRKVFAGHSNFSSRDLGRRLYFVTLMRHPLYRIVSLYFYCRKYQNHLLHDLSMANDLSDFYTKASNERPKYFNNVMCSRICGKPSAEAAISLIEEEYLAVGMTENLGVFVNWFLGSQNLPREEVPQSEPDRMKYAQKIEDADFVNRVMKSNAEDVALFEHMNRKYFRIDENLYPNSETGAMRN